MTSAMAAADTLSSLEAQVVAAPLDTSVHSPLLPDLSARWQVRCRLRIDTAAVDGPPIKATRRRLRLVVGTACRPNFWFFNEPLNPELALADNAICPQVCQAFDAWCSLRWRSSWPPCSW